MRVFHVARCVAVKSAAKTAEWRRGKVRRAYCIFSGPKQDRMSAWAHWVAARAATAANVRANFPFSTLRWVPTVRGRGGSASVPPAPPCTPPGEDVSRL